MNNKLNETSRLKDIEDNYFVRMMLPDSVKKAELYVAEESKELIQLISHVTNVGKMNFVVIGAGTLWYIEMVYEKVKQYIAIEPLADIFIQNQISFILKKHKNIKVIGKDFGEFKKTDLAKNNSIFVFHFNILSYIPDPIDKINKYLTNGDILYISSWSDSGKAKYVRKAYFDYLNQNKSFSSFRIDPEKTVGLCNLDIFPFKKLKYYKRHKRIKGKITDILIIYC